MTRVISVVLPEPLQPASPIMRMLMAYIIGTLGGFRDPYMTESHIDLRELRCPLPTLRTCKAPHTATVVAS